MGGVYTAITPSDSIQGLLVQLLLALARSYPQENWGFFVDGERPDWSKVFIAGHSQGAAHAAYLARILRLAGAAPISGPQDACIGCPADTPLWTDERFASSGR